MQIIIFFLYPFTALVFYMSVRNFFILSFLKKTMNKMSVKCKEDIKNKRDWKWRFDELEKVSYNEIFYKFWKRLKVENFWDDLSFLERHYPKNKITIGINKEEYNKIFK